MALDPDQLAQDLKTAMSTAITAAGGDITRGTTGESLTALSNSIAAVVIQHFKDNAVITGVCPPGGGTLTEGKIS